MVDYAVVWPRGEKAQALRPLAARPESLEGKRIAFLWDYLFRGDEIFPMLAEGTQGALPRHRGHRLRNLRLHPWRRGA